MEGERVSWGADAAVVSPDIVGAGEGGKGAGEGVVRSVCGSSGCVPGESVSGVTSVDSTVVVSEPTALDASVAHGGGGEEGGGDKECEGDGAAAGVSIGSLARCIAASYSANALRDVSGKLSLWSL